MRNSKNSNKIKLIILTTLLAAAFVGCGGGGGSSASFESETATAIVTCNVTDTSWTPLSSGDVVSASADTQLKFDHDSSGNKQVCVVATNPAGSATVIGG